MNEVEERRAECFEGVMHPGTKSVLGISSTWMMPTFSKIPASTLASTKSNIGYGCWGDAVGVELGGWCLIAKDGGSRFGCGELERGCSFKSTIQRLWME